MGALKHVILPAFGLLHGMSLYACRDVSSWRQLVGIKEEEKEESKTSSHMVGCLRGFNLAMLLLIVVGVSCEGHKFRGKLAMAETALFATAAVDAYQLGLQYQVPAVTSLIGLIGTVLNQMEPGIFTKAK